MSAGTTYRGDMRYEGRVRIDGTFIGSLYSDEDLELGEEGRIEGDVDVAGAMIAGQVHGTLRVREHLRLMPSASINGKLDAGIVELLPGASLRGEVRIRGESLP